MEPDEKLEMWAVIELMGHRRMAGKVSEQVIAGTPLLRIDVPNGDEAFVTQFYGGSAIYCLTPTTEEIARSVAKNNQPKPVHTFELPQLEAARKPQFGDAPPGGYSCQDEEQEDDDEDGETLGDGDGWG